MADDDQNDDAQGADQQDTADDQGDDQLGDAGKQALDRMKTERNQARSELRQYKSLGLSVDDIKALQKPAEGDDKVDPDALRAEGRREVNAKANERILRSEVKAAAAGKLADPADAHKFLDLSQFGVDDDGNVDEDEIADAIEELVKRKPYLAVAQGDQRRFRGSADSGARKDKPVTLNDRIAAAEQAGDTRTVLRLKAAQAIASNH